MAEGGANGARADGRAIADAGGGMVIRGDGASCVDAGPFEASDAAADSVGNGRGASIEGATGTVTGGVADS